YVERTTGAVEGHAGSYYFYIRTLINKYHPWIFLVPVGLVYGIHQSFRNKERRAAYLTVLGWIAVVFCFFTFAVQTKLQWYILPLHPALSLIAAVPLTLWWFPGGSELLLKAVIITSAVGQLFFSSVFDHDYSPGLKELAAVIQTDTGQNEKVILYNYHEEPAAVFYTNLRCVYADSLKELDGYQSEFGRVHLIARDQDFAGIAQDLKRRDFVIIRRTSGFKEDLVYLK
ncbi:MAG: hypothetical protein KC649_05730, partial [Candidatus Omnitrophica bacterium]|nr:hypothetical protein [Candidatus Omnitrophota bacterium]